MMRERHWVDFLQHKEENEAVQFLYKVFQVALRLVKGDIPTNLSRDTVSTEQQGFFPRDWVHILLYHCNSEC